MRLIGFGNYIGRSGGGSWWNTLFPEATSKSYAVLDSIANGKYNTYSCISHHPRLKNKILMTYLEGVGHAYDNTKVIKMRTSNDNGQTWGSAAVAYNPNVGGITDLCCSEQHNGYSSDGKFHILVTVTDFYAAGFSNCWLKHLVSTNNGISFTVTDITSVCSDATLINFKSSSNIIENNGVLFGGVYNYNAARTLSRRSVLKYANGVWSRILIDQTIAFATEVVLIALGGDNILAMVRDDAVFDYIQWRSTDNGATWASDGHINFGLPNSTYNCSGRLRRFYIDGEDIIVHYWARGVTPFNLYGIYAKASELITSGLSAWNLGTVKVIQTPAAGLVSKSGDVVHYNQNYNAIGIYPQHYSLDLSYANLLTFEIDTTNYDSLKFILDHQGIIAYYKLNEGTGVTATDSSGFGYDGTITNGTWVDGKIGAKALSFDGTAFVVCNGVLAKRASSTSGAWACWVKPVDETPVASGGFISMGDLNGDSNMSFHILATSGLVRGVAILAGVTAWDLRTTNNPFTAGAWTHVMVMHNGTAPVLYVNGIAVAQSFTSQADKTVWIDNLGGLDICRLGCLNSNNAGNTSLLVGVLDDVRLYNRVLTPTEITDLIAYTE